MPTHLSLPFEIQNQVFDFGGCGTQKEESQDFIFSHWFSICLKASRTTKQDGFHATYFESSEVLSALSHLHIHTLLCTRLGPYTQTLPGDQTTQTWDVTMLSIYVGSARLREAPGGALLAVGLQGWRLVVWGASLYPQLVAWVTTAKATHVTAWVCHSWLCCRLPSR